MYPHLSHNLLFTQKNTKSGNQITRTWVFFFPMNPFQEVQSRIANLWKSRILVSFISFLYLFSSSYSCTVSFLSLLLLKWIDGKIEGGVAIEIKVLKIKELYSKSQPHEMVSLAEAKRNTWIVELVPSSPLFHPLVLSSPPPALILFLSSF